MWQLIRNRLIEVIRFTSHEIENDTQRVLFAIDVVLKRLLKQDAPPHPPTPSPPEEEKGSQNISFAMLQSRSRGFVVWTRNPGFENLGDFRASLNMYK